MDLWISQSNPTRQTALSVACSMVGLVLVIGFRHFSGLDSNAAAGFLMGVFLLILGVAGFLVSGKQTVVIDPKARSITVEDSNRFGTRRRTILFSEVVGVGIGYLGKRSNHVEWYYLVLELGNGKNYSLFPPGRFYEGGSNKSTVESWKRRLEECLKQ